MNMFKKMDNGNIIIDYKIKGYTEDEIVRYMESPITYQSQLIDLSNFVYATQGFYRESIDFYVKPTLYRYTVDTKVTNPNFEKVKEDKLKKDFIIYSARIDQLNLGRELHRILLRAFLEDSVCGYWIESGENATLFYLPVSWCLL